MFRLVCLILFLNSFAEAGTVKTFEGTKIEKDSVVELRLYFEVKSSQTGKVFAASVTKIDETELYDKRRRGPDYSSTLRDEKIDLCMIWLTISMLPVVLRRSIFKLESIGYRYVAT